jgi:hypothetical protein
MKTSPLFPEQNTENKGAIDTPLHLHNHTQFSVLQSTISIAALVKPQPAKCLRLL